MPAQDLPSMNPPSNLPSNDPQVAGEALTSYIAEQARQMADQVRSHMMFSSEFTRGSKQVLAELKGLASDISSVRSEMSGGLGSGGGGTDPGTGRALPSMATRAPTTPPRATPSAPPQYTSFSEGRQMGESMRMGDVTQAMARAGSRLISQHQSPGWSRDTSVEGSPLRTQYVDGTLSYVKQDPINGGILSHIPVNQPGALRTVARAEAVQSRLGTVTGALGRYGAGEGIAGALGGSAMKLAGPIGIALGVGQQIGDKIGEQTEAGAQWRRIYGEDAGRFAMSQRGSEFLSGAGSFFRGTGFGRGKEAYDSMAGLGLRGEGLDDAVNFDRQMYLQHGMDSKTSAQFVQMSRDTSTSLESLSNQIDKVGKAAVAAGQNSEQAIASFVSATQSLRGGGVAATGAVAAGASITEAVKGQLPTSLATDENVAALAGSVTQPNLMQYAARTGQDWRTVSQQVATDPTGAAATAVAQGSLDQAVEIICQSAGTSKQEVAARAQKVAPGATTLSPDAQAAVLKFFPNINGVSVASIFAKFGLNFPPDQQIPMFFQSVMGNIDVTAGTKTEAPGSPGAYNGDPTSLFPGVAAASGTYSGHSALAAGNAAVSMMYSDVGKAYTAYAEDTGQRSGAIESLISGSGAKQILDYSGAGTLDDVKVQTSKGEMSLSDLLSDPDLIKGDLASGGVSVVGGGSHEGDQLDLSTIVGSSAAAASGATASGNSWILSLTPEAQRMFNFTGPSDAQRSGAPAVGFLDPSNYGW